MSTVYRGAWQENTYRGAWQEQITTTDVSLSDSIVPTDTVPGEVDSGLDVSAIVAGGTEATLTTESGADDTFADGDAVIVYDGTGYSKQGYVDGSPGDTSVDVDDGAGAAVADIEKVGVFLSFNGSRKGTAGNVCDITTGDFSINGWFDIASAPGANAVLVSKKDEIADNSAGYAVYIDPNGYLNWKVSKGDASDSSDTTGAVDVCDGLQHQFTVSFDRSGNGVIYVDGNAYATVAALSNVGANSITNASHFHIGATYSGGSPANYLTGDMRDISITSDRQTRADAFTLARGPMTAPADNVVCFWECADNTGTTAAKTSGTGGGDITIDDAAMWSQDAYVSKNLLGDGGFEN